MTSDELNEKFETYRVRQLKIVMALVAALIGFGGTTVGWVFNTTLQVERNKSAIELSASGEDLEDIKQQVDHMAHAINWLGTTVYSIAGTMQIQVERPPLINQ